MKKLLLSSILMLTTLISFAQADCASAVPITANGTITSAAISGTYEISCDQTNPDAAGPYAGNWYSYTATANGIVDITSNLPANVAPNSVDTRVSVWDGTCAALTCITGADDISASNYLSTISFTALTGVTYYIQWDDRWDSAGFDFTFTFTPVSCFPVLIVNSPTATTTTSVTLNWAAATGTPASYDVEYGAVGFVQGSGTSVSTATNSVSITTGLTASTNYDFYVRSNCGANQSTWSTVNTFTTAKILPYTSNFDSSASLIGWVITTNGPGGQGYNATGTAGQAASPGYWIFGSSTTTVNNNWLFSPAISLVAGEQVTPSFYTRSSTSPRTLRVTVGTNNTPVAQTTVLAALSIASGTVWNLNTIPAFTAPADGIYYFGFNDNSASTATAVNMRLDTFSFTSVLGTNDFLSNNFSVYPNPANNVINFSNNENAIVNLIEMTDMNGRVVKSFKVNATEGQVSVNDLATGIYMMKISTDQGIATKKIVKQ